MRWKFSFLFISALLVVSCGKNRTEAKPAASPVELTMVDFASGIYSVMQKKLESDFTRETGIKVKTIVGNESAASLFSEQMEWLRAGSRIPDVCYLDNVWAGSLNPYLLDLTPYVTPEQRAEIIPQVLQAYLVGNRLVALPKQVDFPLLYYRTDLLKKYRFHGPPKTWDELERMASIIQNGERREGNKNFWGYVWEGAANEALTCVGQEYQISSGGGHMLEADGSVSVNNSKAIRAFARAASWINRISPPGTPAYAEEDAQEVWEIGNAAFARNWNDYAKDQLESSRMRGKFGVAVLPHDPGESSVSTVGGWGLGVSKYSLHPREAVRLVEFLTNRATQRRMMQQNSDLPTLAVLYSDPFLQASTAYLHPIQTALFRSAVPRPVGVAGDHYEEVSAAYAKGIHSVLIHQKTAPEAMAELEQELLRITRQKTEVSKLK